MLSHHVIYVLIEIHLPHTVILKGEGRDNGIRDGLSSNILWGDQEVGKVRGVLPKTLKLSELSQFKLELLDFPEVPMIGFWVLI